MDPTQDKLNPQTTNPRHIRTQRHQGLVAPLRLSHASFWQKVHNTAAVAQLFNCVYNGEFLSEPALQPVAPRNSQTLLKHYSPELTTNVLQGQSVAAQPEVEKLFSSLHNKLSENIVFSCSKTTTKNKRCCRWVFLAFDLVYVSLKLFEVFTLTCQDGDADIRNVNCRKALTLSANGGCCNPTPRIVQHPSLQLRGVTGAKRLISEPTAGRCQLFPRSKNASAAGRQRSHRPQGFTLGASRRASP